MTARSAEVVVIGAGVAGLTAARELHRRGVDVLVLESADRVGGRTLAETSTAGSRLDVGGQWVGRGHRRFEALAGDLGLTLFAMSTPRRPDLIRGARRFAPWGLSLLEANLVLARWELGARGARNPAGWAGQTVRAWLERRVRSAEARRGLEVVVAAATCTDPATYEMAAFGDLIRHQGGLAGMLRTRGGAQESLVLEGAGSIASRLAEELDGRVRTGSPVTRVAYDDAGAAVDTEAGTVRAARVIVTVPPPMQAAIAFDPPLPASHRRLVDRTRMGTVYKAIAVYDRPFWRVHRRAAEFIVLDEPGTAVFDSSPPGVPGHLTLLVPGPEARTLDPLTSAERRARILAPLARHLGADVERPTGWHEKAWHLDPHAGGGYAALPTSGSLRLPVDHAPLGRLHWAGTETANEHAGYIEGAIESGERAVAEVVAALGRE